MNTKKAKTPKDGPKSNQKSGPTPAQYEELRTKALELATLLDSYLQARGDEMTAREWIDKRKARKAQAKQRRAAKAKSTQSA